MVSFLLSVLSFYLFDAYFSALLFYGDPWFGEWAAVYLIAFIRAGYAWLVSRWVMATRSIIWMSLLLGVLIYGVPSIILSGRLSPFVTPLILWVNEVMNGVRVQPVLDTFLRLSLLALILDFPRLILFIAVERRIAGPEAISKTLDITRSL